MTAIVGLVAGVAVAAPSLRLRIAETSAAEFWTGSCNRSGPESNSRRSTRLRWNGSQWRASAVGSASVYRTPSSELGSNEPRRCSGQLPTPRSQGYDGLATRMTMCNLGGAVFGSWAGVTPTTHHDLWQQQSGVHSEAPMCWEHKFLCQTFWFAVQYDRLDESNAARLELVTRLGDNRAGGQAQPECPSFCVLASPDRQRSVRGGWVTTKDFTARVAEIAEEEARILKQNRLLREEIVHSTKADQKQDNGKGAGRKSPETGCGTHQLLGIPAVSR